MNTSKTYQNGKIKLTIYGFFKEKKSIKLLMHRIPMSGMLDKELINNIRRLILGKYLISIERSQDKIWINDIVGSFRRYINFNTKEVFEDFPISFAYSSREFDFNQVTRVYDKGYTQGHKTVLNGICKLHPAAVYYQLNNQQYIIIPDYLNNNSTPEKMNEFYNQYVKNFNKEVGIAFSGGVDSLYLVKICMNRGITPKLYHMNLLPNDKDSAEDLQKAKYSAKVLGLSLNIIQIDRKDVDLKLKGDINDMINDLTFSFVAIKLFLHEIDKINEVEVLLTGQNADSFISYGVTRSYHPIESLLLYSYKFIFKKIFLERGISILDRIILSILYRLRGLSSSDIPKNKTELINGLANDFHYLPRYTKAMYDNPEYVNVLNDKYLNFIMCNKLTNHIGGNHSIVWSDDKNLTIDILMPFSEYFFIQACYGEMKAIRTIFEPKKLIKESLKVLCTPKEIQIVSKSRGSIKSSNFYADTSIYNDTSLVLNKFFKRSL